MSRVVSTVRRVALALAVVGASSALAAESAPIEDAAVEAKPRGLLIGRFMIRDLRAAEGAKLRLSFALYAEVDEQHAAGVEGLLQTHNNRIRNQVLIAIRTCEQHEFQEPGLERLRRRIRFRLQRTMPALTVGRLLIGEFEFFNN